MIRYAVKNPHTNVLYILIQRQTEHNQSTRGTFGIKTLITP